jgi:tetratricopeptide (TPR) repeat protein
VGDRWQEAYNLHGLGSVYASVSDHQPALDYFQQALALTRAIGDRLGEATVLNDLGLLYYRQGQPQPALDYYQQALPLRPTA